MKLADMYKSKGSKINNSIKPHGAPGKPGSEPAALDRREQRRLDQEKGLVAFACKLNGDLIKRLHATAEERGVPLNDLVGELITAGLEAGAAASKPAPAAAPAKPKAAKTPKGA